MEKAAPSPPEESEDFMAALMLRAVALVQEVMVLRQAEDVSEEPEAADIMVAAAVIRLPAAAVQVLRLIRAIRVLRQLPE
jgi:hypothetical protein